MRFYPKEARTLYQQSTDQETFHFFCVTGISITGKLIESLKKNPVPFSLDKYILAHLEEIKTDGDFAEVLSYLYFQMFTLFNDIWVKQRPTNIMNFTQNFDDIFQGRFKNQITEVLNTFFKTKKETTIKAKLVST